MAEQAKITSIDALEAFRANLVIFLTRAHGSVDEVGDEIRRTRLWLQDDQRQLWEREIRKRTRLLGDARQELLRAKMSGLRDNTIPQEAAVQKATRALHEAEEKLQNVKRWNRNYESATDPLTRRLQSLQQFLDHDIPKAISYLLQAQRTLEGYTDTPSTGAASHSPPPPEAAPEP